MRLGLIAALVLCVVLAPVGLFCLAFLLRLGMMESFDKYGTTFTLLVSAGLIPVFLAIAFLFDRQQARTLHSQEDRQSGLQ